MIIREDYLIFCNIELTETVCGKSAAHIHRCIQTENHSIRVPHICACGREWDGADFNTTTNWQSARREQ